MQNKANFRKSQMNVNPYNTKDYENISDWTLSENKPNSNPNKANFKRDLAKMGHHEFKRVQFEDKSGILEINRGLGRKAKRYIWETPAMIEVTYQYQPKNSGGRYHG